MKRLLLLSLALLASCTSTRVEEYTLIPAIVSAWPAVRSDVMESDFPPLGAVESMDTAVEAESKDLLRQVPWDSLSAAATDGIQNQLDDATIGINGAILLMEQLEQMTAAMNQLQKPVLVSLQVQELQSPNHCIALSPRTSWYASPPAGICPSYNR